MREMLLTTQPGWAFATLVELRGHGVRGQVPFYHRDSSLVASAGSSLVTPAEVVCRG